ncbi:MAG: DUF4440 domain-containing protein [Gemmatimonadetes bacterium]|nr:DUF4440 domain-containing protein [Gemmatimonadota bacterium]NIO32218.1 DUF4440 domain-containing protein [Gemmatimonadota bacterium]
MDSRSLALSLAAFLIAPGPTLSQETEVREALQQTFAALNAGRVEEFLSYFVPRAQLFLHFGCGLGFREGIDSTGVEAWHAPFEGYAFDLEPHRVRVQVQGNSAVASAYIHGTVRYPYGLVSGGPWRYSETRILDQGKWKIVQQLFSLLGERASRIADPGFGRRPAVENPAYPWRPAGTAVVDSYAGSGGSCGLDVSWYVLGRYGSPSAPASQRGGTSYRCDSY